MSQGRREKTSERTVPVLWLLFSRACVAEVKKNKPKNNHVKETPKMSANVLYCIGFEALPGPLRLAKFWRCQQDPCDTSGGEEILVKRGRGTWQLAVLSRNSN